MCRVGNVLMDTNAALTVESINVLYVLVILTVGITNVSFA